MDVLDSVIHKSETLQKVPKENHSLRRKTLTSEFFNASYEYACKGLMQEHRTLFAMRLVQIRKADDKEFEAVFNMLMKSTTILNSTLSDSLLDGRLTNSQRASLEELNKYPQFKGLVASIQHESEKWISFLDS